MSYLQEHRHSKRQQQRSSMEGQKRSCEDLERMLEEQLALTEQLRAANDDLGSEVARLDHLSNINQEDIECLQEDNEELQTT